MGQRVDFFFKRSDTELGTGRFVKPNFSLFKKLRVKSCPVPFFDSMHIVEKKKPLRDFTVTLRGFLIELCEKTIDRRISHKDLKINQKKAQMSFWFPSRIACSF